MTAKQLVKALAKETDYMVEDVQKVMDALEKVVSRELRSGANVDIGNLVRLSKKKRKARKGRTQWNAIAGRDIDIPPIPEGWTVHAKVKDLLKKLFDSSSSSS